MSEGPDTLCAGFRRVAPQSDGPDTLCAGFRRVAPQSEGPDTLCAGFRRVAPQLAVSRYLPDCRLQELYIFA